MAFCPQCKTNLSVKQLMSGNLVCQQCGQALKFVASEYKQVTSPGIYIAIFIIINTVIVQEPKIKYMINILLLILWFIFFKRFLDYLNRTGLELEGDG